MADMAIDTMRHVDLFNPDKFNPKEVHIIGCGATGSRIAMQLAKLGITQLHLWDFDKVESHNIANQLFGNKDVGKFKVDALSERIEADTGTKPYIHNEAVTGRTRLTDFVFLLTDTMKSRKEIWEGAIRWKPNIHLMIETRMGLSEGRVYAFAPTNPPRVKDWEATLFNDDDKGVEVSVCGTRMTVGATAELVSGYAVWALVDFFRSVNGGKVEAPVFENIFMVNPPMILAR